MNQNKKPSWKERFPNWTPSEIMILAIITTTINVITIVVNVLRWL